MGYSINIIHTPLAGIFVIETSTFVDRRGAFFRAFCARELEPILGKRQIVQINHSKTLSTGALRGLHYQNPPHSEMKLVRCLKGSVWDVAVDLRRDSPTFLKWYGTILSSHNANMLVIPEGCAHGFQVLEENSELLYLHTNFYVQEYENGLLYNDPKLDIKWPLPIVDLSKRDQTHSLIKWNFRGITI